MAQPSLTDDQPEPIGQRVQAAAMRSNQSLLLVDGITLRILDVNHACHANFGYPLEMLLNLRLLELIAEQHRETLQRAVSALNDGSVWTSRLLCEAQRADQSTWPVALNLEVDPDPDSSRVKFLVSLTESSENEQLYISMQTALQAADIQFSSWQLDSEALRPWQFQNHPDQPPSPSPVSAFLRKLCPADRRETMTLLSAVSSGVLQSLDITVRTPEINGSDRWLRLCGVVPPHKPGTLLALQTDVTEAHRIQDIREERDRALKIAEDRLQASEVELQELLALIPDFIVRLDARSVIKYASPSFAEDYQPTGGDLVGASLLAVLNSESRHAFSEALGCLHDNIHIHEFVLEETREDTTRSIWWTLLKMRDAHADRGTICLGRDVTERSKARRQLERQAKQLQRSNNSLDDFASVVSHDLQAPMRHIVHFSELLAGELRDGDEQCKQYLEVLQSSAQRLQEMTTNLLNYSRLGLQYERMQMCQLTQLIADAIDMLADPMASSRAQVDIGLLPELRLDPLLATRLFQNLLSNSIKYCHAGATPQILVSSRQCRDHWLIYWADKGIGIDPSQSERIFRIFARLHADETEYSGSGVGLALCKRIVESHGGEIWLDTDYLEGARFCIRLPITNDEDNELFQ